MLRQTCGRENLIGIGSASLKSVHTLSGKSSPMILIFGLLAAAVFFRQSNTLYFFLFFIMCKWMITLF